MLYSRVKIDEQMQTIGSSINLDFGDQLPYCLVQRLSSKQDSTRVAVLLVISHGRLVGVVSGEELATVFLVLLTPMMFIFGAMVLRWGFEK